MVSPSSCYWFVYYRFRYRKLPHGYLLVIVKVPSVRCLTDGTCFVAVLEVDGKDGLEAVDSYYIGNLRVQGIPDRYDSFCIRATTVESCCFSCLWVLAQTVHCCSVFIPLTSLGTGLRFGS